MWVEPRERPGDEDSISGKGFVIAPTSKVADHCKAIHFSAAFKHN